MLNPNENRSDRGLVERCSDPVVYFDIPYVGPYAPGEEPQADEGDDPPSGDDELQAR